MIASSVCIPCLQPITISSLSASSSKTTDVLLSLLHAAGLPDTSAAHAFINHVHQQTPRRWRHRHAIILGRNEAENDAKALRDQLSSFVDDPTSSSSVTEIKKDKSKGSARDKRYRERHTRRQEADAREWESDEEDKPESAGGHTGKQMDLQLRTRWPRSFRKTNPNGANGSRIRENGTGSPSTFGAVIKTRPKKSSRIIRPRPWAPGAIAEAGLRRQLADDTVARTLAMPSLHERSRQEYLTKRELHQVELRRKEIADDEALFRGMRISKREQRELDHKKEDHKFVEERLRIDDKWDGYVQPEITSPRRAR